MLNTSTKSQTTANVNLHNVAVTTAVEIISARTELKEVEARLKELEDTFKHLNTDITLENGTTVKVAHKARRTVDTAKLMELLPREYFKECLSVWVTSNSLMLRLTLIA